MGWGGMVVFVPWVQKRKDGGDVPSGPVKVRAEL